MKVNKSDIIKILPSQIKEKYNCIKIDNKYISVMTVISFEKVIFQKLMEQIFMEEEIKMSIRVSKQNGNEFLKKITRFVSESAAEIRTIKKNQIDVELLEMNKKEAEEIKKEIQVNNEEVFLIELCLGISGKSEQEVEAKSTALKNRLYSKGMILRPAFFNQKEVYKSMLPLLIDRNLLSSTLSNVLLTSSFAILFPFFVKDNMTKDGVFIGKIKDKYAKISLLSKENLNHNMCVFGSSGVGKSFFIKLLILRHAYKDTNQIIIDPEGEYENLVKSIGGKVYTVDTYNPMYIEEFFAKTNNDYYKQTIDLTKEYIKEKYRVDIMEDKLEACIENLFKEYGIYNKLDSLYSFRG